MASMGYNTDGRKPGDTDASTPKASPSGESLNNTTSLGEASMTTSNDSHGLLSQKVEEYRTDLAIFFPKIDEQYARKVILDCFELKRTALDDKFGIYTEKQKLQTFLEEWRCFDLAGLTDTISAKSYLENLYRQACEALDLEKFSREHETIYKFFSNVLPRELMKLGIVSDVAMFPQQFDDSFILVPITEEYSLITEDRGQQIIPTSHGDVSANIYYVSNLDSALAVARYGSVFIDHNKLVDSFKLPPFVAANAQQIGMSDCIVSSQPDLHPLDPLGQRKAAIGFTLYKIKAGTTDFSALEKAVLHHEAEHIPQKFNIQSRESVTLQVIQSEFDARVNQLRVDGKLLFCEALEADLMHRCKKDAKQGDFDIQGTIPSLLILDLLMKSFAENPEKFQITIDSQSGISPEVQILGQLHKTANLNIICYDTLEPYIGRMNCILSRLGITEIPWIVASC